MTPDDRDRPRYYLIGAAGWPNYGDELIASIWLRYLAEIAPHADVWLDCQAPGNARLLLGTPHPRVNYVDTLWRLSEAAPSGRPWDVAAWVQHAVRDSGHAPRWGAGIELLRDVDVIHVIGGGYLAGVWPTHIGLLAGAVAAAQPYTRVAATGQGVWPPAPHTEPLLRSLTERFDVVDVRDEPSAELLGGAAAGVTHGGDDVLLAIDQVLIDRRPVPKYMVCAQSDTSEFGTEELAAFVLSWLRSQDVKPEDLGIVEGIPRADREVYALFEHAVPGARFYPFQEVWTEGLPVAAGQTWLSTRFHPHLVAAHGAGGVAISVHSDFYASKHQSLLALGSPWTMVGKPLPSSVEPPAPSGFPAGVLSRQRGLKREIARRVYPAAHSSPRQTASDGAGSGDTGSEPGARFSSLRRVRRALGDR
ncbi:polysaccharide pyruvyl transferase family protein [Amycolatopsis sp. SID8362]|uniref:polysaccharide pyruvyl transferase family protein n=1 Tax=Amycolatopsis sp. SID8362 TaxID=2690346 RepID=UPI002816245E|nr:polysaccharide pyruvyl transferase family protein [Amycolatopsis sp. SID8362]